jgi:predicted nucleic acid-binding protein
MSLVLVDSSMCIAYLRQKLSPEADATLAELFLSDHLAITRLIWIELYCGIRSKREESELANFISDVRMLDTDDQCWKESARIARLCQRKGVNVPLSDIQVQACANRYGVDLLHNDKHFDLIQSTLS